MCKAFEEVRKESWERGIQQGKQQGETLFGKLISALLTSGRSEEIARVAEDASYRAKLYQEFGLA